jgi:hypothetical protein
MKINDDIEDLVDYCHICDKTIWPGSSAIHIVSATYCSWDCVHAAGIHDTKEAS